MVLYNFALVKDGLTFIILKIFEPLTFLFYEINQLLGFTRVFSDLVSMIFELSGIVSSDLINSDLA